MPKTLNFITKPSCHKLNEKWWEGRSSEASEVEEDNGSPSVLPGHDQMELALAYSKAPGQAGNFSQMETWILWQTPHQHSPHLAQLVV